MSLSNKHKSIILKKYRKLPAKKVAEELNLNAEEVQNYLNEINKKPPFYFYIFLILLPVIFLILLETGLRVFDYGYNTDQWIEITPEYLGLNHEVGRRYFNSTSTIPISIQDVFAKEKKENTFRVFVLGGSSGAGYPYLPIGSFSRYLKQRLELVYPESTIEVVNLSLTAINSYTILDFMPEVINQKPDLIIIYAGHNEYYGALGVGSMESFSSSRTVVNFILYLNKFKTTQLLRDTIKYFSSLLFEKEKASGTLMSRMAKEQSIPFDSEVFNAGVEQFKENMKDVLKIAKGSNVPVMLGTLVSNLKDQPPFISANSNGNLSADKLFENANEELKKGNYKNAASFFRKAKDFDELRFRAPEKINETIIQLAKEFGNEVVQIDSVLNAISPEDIVGNNLMTDHLHPTLEGYKIIGKLYYEKMYEKKYLPHTEPLNFSLFQQDSIVNANFSFSKFDSILADFKIRALKNDWPYIDKNKAKSIEELFHPKNFIDSTALDVIYNNMEWQKAQSKIADWYIKQKDYEGYLNQMNVLINNFPIIVEYYDAAANEMLQIQNFDKAYKIFEKRYKQKPSAFATKWLGNIDLFYKRTDSAIKYLSESVKLKSDDAQVLYNLAGAYSQKKNYTKALEIITKCLNVDPNYPQAENLKRQLILITKK